MIVKIPNPILTEPAKDVVSIDKKILAVVEDMKKHLLSAKNPKGVGLAAPQIGIPLRIFITKPDKNSPIEVYLNPLIFWASEELSEIQRPDIEKPSLRKDKKLEGCLSIPNIWGYLKRPAQVKIRYLNLSGKISEKIITGFLATIVQHETDHLNGILFTQRVLEQNEKLYRIDNESSPQEKLVEIKI